MKNEYLRRSLSKPEIVHVFRCHLILTIFISLIMAVSTNSIAGKGTTKSVRSNLVNKNYHKLVSRDNKAINSEVNLLKNSGFEQFDAATGVFPNWLDWKKQCSPSIDAASGNRSIKVTYNDKPTWDKKIIRCFIVQNIKLNSGNYSFSCKVKSNNLTNLFVQLLDKNGKSFKSSNHSFRIGGSTDNWQKYQANLTIPPDANIQRIILYFWGDRTKAGFVLVDDVKLLSTAVVSNVIFNSSFEICTVVGAPDRWHSETGAIGYPGKYETKLDSTTARTGTDSVKMSFHGSYDKVKCYYTRLMSGFYSSVAEGEPYTVSVWMKSNNPPVKVDLQMNWINRKTLVVNSKEWKKYSFTAIWRRPERKTRNAFLIFSFAGKEGEKIDADVWIDDVMAQFGSSATAWQPASSDKLYLDKMFTINSNKKSCKIGNSKKISALKVNSKEVTIDGKLDERFWSNCSPAQCSTPFKKSAVKSATNCRVAYDDNFLYVAIDARYSKGKQPRQAEKGKAGAFTGDWVEFFLDPNSEDNLYYQFAINYAGNIYTTKCLFDPIAFELPGIKAYSAINWRPKIDYMVTNTATGWQAELKIPLNLFSQELGNDKISKLNFYRVIPATGEANCWCKTKQGFHDIPLFGTLTNFNPPQVRAFKFPKINYLLAPDGNSVVGKLSTADGIDQLTAEIVGTYHATQQLKVTKKDGSLSFIIPLKLQQAMGKLIRVIAQTSKGNFQEFSTVEINKSLSLSVDSIVFTKEKTVSCGITVKLPQSDWAKSELIVAIIRRGTSQTVGKQRMTINRESNIYKIPFLSAVPGWYDIVVTLKQAGKVIASEKSCCYISKKDKNYVRVSPLNNRLERNGKPFFPLSFWVSLRNPQCNIAEVIKQQKALGANTIVIPAASYFSKYSDLNFDRIFSTAKKQGLAVIVDFTKLLVLGMKCHGYSKEKVINIINDFVMKYKDEPNLLMYHIMDEPGVHYNGKVQFSSPAELKDIYWMIKQLDPYHPCFNNLSPRIWAWNDLSATDIFSYDCYNQSLSPFKTDMERVLYYLQAGEKCAESNGKPMFNVLMFSDSTEIRNSRLLRYNEQRCLAYLHILNGSKGIFFYSELSWCSQKNQQLVPILKELNFLAPMLLGYNRQATVETNSRDIVAKYFEYAGKRWLICANSSNLVLNAVKLKLDKLAPTTTKAIPVFNGNKSVIKAGVLELDFPPYGCFVYKLIK